MLIGIFPTNIQNHTASPEEKQSTPASRQVISEIYKHLFEADIDSSILESINDKFYSPAEIINIYMNEEQNAERFITRLQLNEHVQKYKL